MAETPPKPQLKISIHPAAAIFPMMSDDELANLAESIKTHGLREKIHAIISVNQSTTDWEVIDGRNRLEALRRYLKISDVDLIASYMTPISMTGSFSPEEYVVMANIERRNLTQAQRRDLAGKLAVMLQERQKDVPKPEQIDSIAAAANAAGVSRRTAASAKQDAIKPKPPTMTKDKPESKYIPLRPPNALAVSENVYKSMSHEENIEVAGKMTTQLYLDGWTLEEIRAVQQVVQAIDQLIDTYLTPRLERERAALEAKLSAMNKATSE